MSGLNRSEGTWENAGGRAKNGISPIRSLIVRELEGGRRRRVSSNLYRWMENKSLASGKVCTYDIGLTAKSTISISFSADGKRFASSHGDHTVKVFSSCTGKLLCSLRGHLRTPWTVKFHPVKSNLLASGCLGSQVRLWDADEKTCIRSVILPAEVQRLATGREHARVREIVSLSFHPSQPWVAIASGRTLWLWNYDEKLNIQPWKLLTRGNHRCVVFSPDGNFLITGETCSDSPLAFHKGNGRKERTVQLVKWELNVNNICKWFNSKAADSFHFDEMISRCDVILPYVVLYNDGGFGVSKCGRHLCTVAFRPKIYPVAPNPERDSNDDGALTFQVGPKTNTNSSSGQSQTNIDSESSLSTEAQNRFRQIALFNSGQRLREQRSNHPNLIDGTSRSTARSNQAHTQSDGSDLSTGACISTCRSQQAQTQNDGSIPSPPKLQRISSTPIPRISSGGIRRNILNANTVHHTPNDNRASNNNNRASNNNNRASNSDQARTNMTPSVPSNTVSSANRFRIAERYNLEIVSLEQGSVGKVIQSTELKGAMAKGITSVKFSPTCDHIVLGYGVKDRVNHQVNPNISGSESTLSKQRIAAVYDAYNGGGSISLAGVLSSDIDDLNIAVFHPLVGHGLVYGTRKGLVRCFGLNHILE